MTRIVWAHRGRLWTRILLLWTLVLGGWVGMAAEEAPSLTGVYRDDRVVLELGQAVQTAGATRYTGTIQLGEQKFPLTLEAEDNRLKGTFESQGDQFGFTGSVAGRMLVFTTDGTTYRLSKQVVNPLARAPTKPNPLAQPRTNLPPSASSLPAAAPPVRTTAVPTVTGGPVNLKGNAVRLTRYSVMDDSSMIGGEAFSMLIPADWQVEGGLAWRIHGNAPAYIAMRVANSNRTEVLEAFPAIPFVWTEGGIPLFPPGSNYMGNEVWEPIEEPVVYVNRVILPKFRRGLPLFQIVATEDMPKVAEAILPGGQDPAGDKRCRAVRMRLEYPENGKVMQEDIYCVMTLTYVPALRTTFWGPDRNYSFKAEKGTLDARTRIFQTIISSVRPNLQWFNRYVQLIQVLSQTPLDSLHRVNDLARLLPRTTDEINELRRQGYDRQLVAQDRVNASFSAYIRGLDQFRNPLDSRTVELPTGYAEVWTNSQGDYLLSDEAGFTPNTGTATEWQKVEKVR